MNAVSPIRFQKEAIYQRQMYSVVFGTSRYDLRLCYQCLQQLKLLLMKPVARLILAQLVEFVLNFYQLVDSAMNVYY